MGFNFPLSGFDTFRQPRHLEHGFLIPAGGHDVCVSLMLNTFDGRTFRPDNQTYYPIRNPDLDGNVSRYVGGRTRRSAGPRAQTSQVVLSGRADLREVLRRGQYFTLGFRYILLSSGDHKHRFLAAHGGLNVGVGFGAQCFDLATCNKRKFSQYTSSEYLSRIRLIFYVSLLMTISQTNALQPAARSVAFTLYAGAQLARLRANAVRCILACKVALRWRLFYT